MKGRTKTPRRDQATPPPPLGVPIVTADQALAATSGSVVVWLEEWSLGLAEELSRHALAHPVAQVPVRCDGALTVIGPVLRPGTAACLCCAELQRLLTVGGRVPWQSPKLNLAGLPSPALAEGILLAAEELLREEPRPAEGATVHLVHNDRATWSTHRVRPFGGCTVCHPLPPDSEQAAEITTVPRPLPEPAVLREVNSRTSTAGLRAMLHDDRFGPVHSVVRSEQSVSGLCSAYVSDGRQVPDGGHGRSTDFDTSERVALFEGLERFAGARPRGRRTVLRAPFASLGEERAVDPERLGLPDPRYHGHPAARTVPYTPQLVLDWVHGWSLTHARAIAVPEHVAYWDAPATGGPHVVYESSNGCGLGNSPQEAVLYGLFEVAERDAFLMAWYAATPLRRIAVPGDDPEVTLLADRTALAGYDLTLLDATNDFGIPAVVAVCRYQGSHPGAPRAFLAAGAHHDPRAAIRSAVVEVAVNVHEAAARAVAPGRPRDPERLRPMLEQPELVVTLDDHVGLGTLPERQPRLNALFADASETDWRDAWPDAPEPVNDLSTLLAETVRRLSAQGLEVIAVGQDEPRVRERLGLYSAKVVVPGSLPMTFGHVNHRTRGLPRLLEVPYRLGRADRLLTYDDLSIDPHPFP